MCYAVGHAVPKKSACFPIQQVAVAYMFLGFSASIAAISVVYETLMICSETSYKNTVFQSEIFSYFAYIREPII